MPTTVIRSILTSCLKRMDVKNRTITFVGTKESQDRTGDIVRVAGWEFDNFQKNPVFLFNHDPSQLPVGKVKKIEILGKEVLFDVEFATPEVNDFADKVFKSFESGFMSAVSVGFIPKDMEAIFSDDGKLLGVDIRRQELLELSAVAIPAHQDALAASVYAKDFKEHIEKSKNNGAGTGLSVTLEEFSKSFIAGLNNGPLIQHVEDDEVELTKAVEAQSQEVAELHKRVADQDLALKELKSQVEELLTLKEAVELSKATMATLNKSIVGLVPKGASTDGNTGVSVSDGSTPMSGTFDMSPLLKAMELAVAKVKENSFKPKGDK